MDNEPQPITEKEITEDYYDGFTDGVMFEKQNIRNIIGRLPDLNRLKDKNAYSDKDRLWYEAVWDTKRKILNELNKESK